MRSDYEYLIWDGHPRPATRSTVIGAQITDPGYVDEAVKAFRAKLDATPMTYEVARKMADRAIDMTNRAEETARAQAGITLFGPAMWTVPRGHVTWHINTMEKEIGQRDPRSTPYERFDDLRKWIAGSYRAMLATSQDKHNSDMVFN